MGGERERDSDRERGSGKDIYRDRDGGRDVSWVRQRTTRSRRYVNSLGMEAP